MKRISPAAFVALKDALTHIYWRKQDLRGFLEVCLSGTELVSRLDWTATKREAVGALITHLQRHESLYQEMLLTLMVETAAMEDFAHLEREDDGAAKVAEARRAVGALKKHVDGFNDLRAEQERAEERQRVAHELAQQRQTTAAALDALRVRFAELIGQGAQERGYSLERLLRDLFDVFDLDPRASFESAASRSTATSLSSPPNTCSRPSGRADGSGSNSSTGSRRRSAGSSTTPSASSGASTGFRPTRSPATPPTGPPWSWPTAPTSWPCSKGASASTSSCDGSAGMQLRRGTSSSQPSPSWGPETTRAELGVVLVERLEPPSRGLPPRQGRRRSLSR